MKVSETTPKTVKILYKIWQWPHLGPATALIAIANIIPFLLSQFDPAMHEGMAYGWGKLILLLDAFAIGIIASLFLGVSVNLSSVLIGNGIRIAKEQNQAALPRTVSDVVVTAVNGEHNSKFWERVEQIKDMVKPGHFMLIIPFQHDKVILSEKKFDGTIKAKELPRDNFWKIDHTPQVEAYEEYKEYADNVGKAFPNFCMSLRTSADKGTDALSAYISAGKRTFAAFIFLLLSIAASAQNSQKIREGLGADFAQVPASGAKVVYHFSNGSPTRTADGKKTILELFTAFGGAESENKGAFVGLEIDGVAKSVKQPKAVINESDGKPKALFGSASSAGGYSMPSLSESIPDSATIRGMIEPIKNEGQKIRARIWEAALPFWELCMWVFQSLLFIILCLIGLFWYMATTARQNGNLGKFILLTQRWASARVLILCWSVTVVVLINEFLYLIYSGFALWLVVVVWAVSLLIATRITNWVTPNGKEVYFDDGLKQYDNQRIPRNF